MVIRLAAEEVRIRLGHVVTFNIARMPCHEAHPLALVLVLRLACGAASRSSWSSSRSGWRRYFSASPKGCHQPPDGASGFALRDRGRNSGGTALVGNWLLSQLGISLPAFRIAGGLLLFSIVSEMVFGVRFERQFRTAERAAEEDVTNMAAFPIAIPLVAGPGAMTATVLLAGRLDARPIYLATLLAVMVIVIGLCIAVFEVASRVGSVLGATANVVLLRILGVVLAALSVQFVIDGIRAIFRP